MADAQGDCTFIKQTAYLLDPLLRMAQTRTTTCAQISARVSYFALQRLTVILQGPPIPMVLSTSPSSLLAMEVLRPFTPSTPK